LLAIYTVRIRKQAHKKFIFLYSSYFVLNCTLNNTWLMLFIFFFREKEVFIHFSIVRVLELVDRTNLSFVDAMS
jgi:hypothetical protein